MKTLGSFMPLTVIMCFVNKEENSSLLWWLQILKIFHTVDSVMWSCEI